MHVVLSPLESECGRTRFIELLPLRPLCCHELYPRCICHLSTPGCLKIRIICHSSEIETNTDTLNSTISSFSVSFNYSSLSKVFQTLIFPVSRNVPITLQSLKIFFAILEELTGHAFGWELPCFAVELPIDVQLIPNNQIQSSVPPLLSRTRLSTNRQNKVEDGLHMLGTKVPAFYMWPLLITLDNY